MKSYRYLVCFAVIMFGLFNADLKAQIISTIAGTGTAGFGGDGGAATAIAARISNPGGIAVDAAGNVYIADQANNCIRKVDATTGFISTVAGTTGFGPIGDGGAATAAHLNTPSDVAVDAAGNIFIADGQNMRIRKVTASTGIITTVGGNGGGFAFSISGDGAAATAANIGSPIGIVLDASGNIYFSSLNNTVRVITLASGIINTYAGSGGPLGDGGPATAANLSFSSCAIGGVLAGLCFDGGGNLLIADPCNNRIRKVTTATGIISTVAGNGTGGYVADGVAAISTQINRPYDVAFDASGNMYIADTRNRRIRMVNSGGIISTIVNTSGAAPPPLGDGGLPTTGRLNSPASVAVKSAGNYYISDGGDNRIRFVNNDMAPSFVGGATQSISFCMGSGANDINDLLAVTDGDVGQTLTWSVTVGSTHGILAAAYTATSTGGTITPTGLTYTPTLAGTENFTVKISDGILSSTTVVTVTINALPAISPISGTASICIGSPTFFSDPVAGGTWNATSGNATVSSSGLVSGVTAGTDVISYTTTNSCGSMSAIYPVTVAVTVVPSVTVSSANGTITCPGIIDDFTADPVGGGTVPTYQWSVNSSPVGTATTYSYIPTPGDIVSCNMISSAVCASPSSVSGSITMDGGTTAVPGISISSGLLGDTACSGVSVSFRATITNGGPAPGYSWTVNGAAAGSTNPFLYSPHDGDIIACTLTSSIPCASPTTAMSSGLNMHVFPTVTPTLDITTAPGNYVCIGTGATFTAVPGFPGSAPEYTWTRNGVNVATGPFYSYVPGNLDRVYCSMRTNVACATSGTVSSSTTTMTVVFPVTPAVNIVSIHSTNMSVGQNDTFVANVGISVVSPTYQWFVNGVAAPGAVTSNFVYTATTAGSPVINCIVGSHDACNTTGSSNFITLHVGVSGVQQVGQESSELTLSPNPNTGTFRMNLVSGYEGKVQVTVTNMLGEKVKEFTTTTNNEVEVKLGQTPGIYFLSATTEQGRFVSKVLVN